jgi:hypothetical protein
MFGLGRGKACFVPCFHDLSCLSLTREETPKTTTGCFAHSTERTRTPCTNPSPHHPHKKAEAPGTLCAEISSQNLGKRVADVREHAVHRRRDILRQILTFFAVRQALWNFNCRFRIVSRSLFPNFGDSPARAGVLASSNARVVKTPISWSVRLDEITGYLSACIFVAHASSA